MSEIFRKAYIGMGSNLGDREAHMNGALDEIAKLGVLIGASSLYETPPFGFADQEDFLNAVVVLGNPQAARILLRELQAIENGLGRVRDIPNGPRTIDLDMLSYEGIIFNTADLQLPHPGLMKRPSVLIPLQEVEPGYLHPSNNLSIDKMITALDKEEEEYVSITQFGRFKC